MYFRLRHALGNACEYFMHFLGCLTFFLLALFIYKP